MRAVLKAALHESDSDPHVMRLVGIVSYSPEYTNRRATFLWPGPNSRLGLVHLLNTGMQSDQRRGVVVHCCGLERSCFVAPLALSSAS